jgi:predicted PurR-regulated permease PerM
MGFYIYQQRKNVILVLTVALGLFITWLCRDIIPALLACFIFYILTIRLQKYLVERQKWPSGLAAATIIAATFFIIVLPLYFIVILIIKKMTGYYNLFNENSKEVNDFISYLQQRLTDVLQQPDAIKNMIATLQGKALGFAGNALSGTLSFFLQTSIMYFVLYFMLANYKKFEEGLLRYLPFEKHDATELGKEIKNITNSNVIGQSIICLAQGTLLGLGFFIFGYKDAFFWGLIAVFVSFLPVVGTPLIFVPASIVAFAQNQHFMAWGLLIYGFVIVTNIDYPLRLWLGKRMGDIHPLITIMGVIIGIPFFGIMGLVFGPMVISVFILLIKIFTKYNQPQEHNTL